MPGLCPLSGSRPKSTIFDNDIKDGYPAGHRENSIAFPEPLPPSIAIETGLLPYPCKDTMPSTPLKRGTDEGAYGCL